MLKELCLKRSEKMHVLTIDEGTTGATAMVFEFSKSEAVKVLGQDTQSFPQHFPRNDWVEHDLDEIWSAVTRGVKNALQESKSTKISAIGITNQRETICFFDRITGAPRRNAIVWQCKRSLGICDALRPHEDVIHQKTGLYLDPYFSASKIAWVFENEPEIKAECESGKTLIGTIDTYLLYRLTGGKSFATETSNASRTLLFDIQKKCWDDDLLKLFSIKNKSCLAEVKDSAGTFGVTKGLDFLPDGIAITGILGDQQAALAGQTCFEEGDAKCTYGTGAFLLVNAGTAVKKSQARLLSTIAWTIAGKTSYALEGSVFISGAAVQFLRDQLHFFKKSSDIKDLAHKGKAAPELYFVPSLSGLGTPQWNPRAKGAFLGMTRATSIEDLARAAVEGMALQVTDLIAAAQLDLKTKITHLAVDGGAASDDLLLNLQAAYAQVTILRPKITASTSLGAGFFAALGAGFFKSLEEIKKQKIYDAEFLPEFLPKEEVLKHTKNWNKAVKAVELFASEDIVK